ncbi:hypothetical protein CMI40_01445 [Candidatus Pacearchaeota archaeon]|jgi:hypothetical protein|nr:hypothetical protein [Candidatus Pacearchaeota archaeon]|tara:strand:- start:13620 stop:13898 length:279 start_codon:yes stop_codon:yes gene_type:complete
MGVSEITFNELLLGHPNALVSLKGLHKKVAIIPSEKKEGAKLNIFFKNLSRKANAYALLVRLKLNGISCYVANQNISSEDYLINLGELRVSY